MLGRAAEVRTINSSATAAQHMIECTQRFSVRSPRRSHRQTAARECLKCPRAQRTAAAQAAAWFPDTSQASTFESPETASTKTTIVFIKLLLVNSQHVFNTFSKRILFTLQNKRQRQLGLGFHKQTLPKLKLKVDCTCAAACSSCSEILRRFCLSAKLSLIHI